MKRLLFVGMAVLVGLLATDSWAQLQVDVKQEFIESFPNAKFYAGSNGNETIYGAPISTGKTPLESAANHISEWKDLYGNDIGDLAIQQNENGSFVQGVMYDASTGRHRFSALRFNQEVSGIPVFRSGIGFLVRNEADNPLVMTGHTVKSLAGFKLPRRLPAAEVSETMLENVWNLMEQAGELESYAHALLKEKDLTETKSVLVETKEADIVTRTIESVENAVEEIVNVVTAPGIEVSDEKLVVWAGEGGQKPRLAVAFVATRGSVHTWPQFHKYLVLCDTRTGEILHSETQVHGMDVSVSGWVTGRATVGDGANECAARRRQRFLPYADVRIIGGRRPVFTDERGVYTIPNGGFFPIPSPVLVQSSLDGRYFDVTDLTLGFIPLQQALAWPPGFLNFMYNPFDDEDEFQTANVNAYYHSNFARDFILGYDPTFPIEDDRNFPVFTNLGAECNAFYTTDPMMVFFVNGGTCTNTAVSDVIYHEYGHHLINQTGNGQGQLGEGTGDALDVVIQDDPEIDPGFFVGDCDNGLRSADNNVMFPCLGPIHSCGRLLSGCVWDFRNELVVTEPDDYRDIGASLFLGMLKARGVMFPGDETIDPNITLIYLTLDDDDANLANGTPHCVEIQTGFGMHNMQVPK